jgi:hypothetical protein
MKPHSAAASGVGRQAEASAPPRPKPCDGCRNSKRCRDEQLGCAALVLFYHSNLNGSPARWSCAPRFPSRELYERAMERPNVAPPVYRKRVVVEDECEE